MARSAFGNAFAEARKAGLKTFEFKGKKYTTELAKPSKPVRAELGSEMGERMTPAESARAMRSFGNPPGSESRVGTETPQEETSDMTFKRGGKVGGSASKRGDGIAQRGKTRGKMV
jgi:hypothetical protein